LARAARACDEHERHERHERVELERLERDLLERERVEREQLERRRRATPPAMYEGFLCAEIPHTIMRAQHLSTAAAEVELPDCPIFWGQST